MFRLAITVGLCVAAFLAPFECAGATAQQANATSSEKLTGLIVLMKFKEQQSMNLPSSDFMRDAINMQISDFYGHVTRWKVVPMEFIVTEYFVPSKGINAYDWWTDSNWDNHFNLLREVAAAIVDGSIKVRSETGALRPVDLTACSLTPDGKVRSVGTTYFVDHQGSGGVPGRANGNSGFYPQTKEVEDAIAKKFGCRLAGYSSGFVVGTYGKYDDPGTLDVGAQIHEIGHEFLEWPDIDRNCYNYGNDCEIIKRISRVNRSGSAKIRDCSTVPSGSTISVSVGDWDVWGFRNSKNPDEFIVFENVAPKGYTAQFCRKNPGLSLLTYRVNTAKQSQVNVPDLAAAKWEDGSPVGFSISNLSEPGDVISFKINSSTSGMPQDYGTASGIKGYPVELYDQPGCRGRVGAFGDSKYYASWMPKMGIQPKTASSISILPGYRVTLCDGSRLQGNKCVLLNTTDRPISIDLKTRNFDKKTASLLVEAIAPKK